MALAVPAVGEGEARYPVVRALRARVAAGAVTKLLARAGVQGRLVDGGAEITVKLPVSHATALLAVSAAGNGRVRVEATTISLASRLALPGWMVGIGMAFARVEKKPGIYRVGPRTLEVDVGQMLRGFRVPLRWEARVHAVRVGREFAEIECSQ